MMVLFFFFFGKDKPGRELVKITNQVLKHAIAACGPGKHFKDIGKTIHNLLRDIDYSVSSQFTGHGIGNMFHFKPLILHHCMCCVPSFFILIYNFNKKKKTD